MNDAGAAILTMILDVHGKLEMVSKVGTTFEKVRVATDALTFLEAPRSTIGDDPLLGLEERVAIRKAISECEEAARSVVTIAIGLTRTTK